MNKKNILNISIVLIIIFITIIVFTLYYLNILDKGGYNPDSDIKNIEASSSIEDISKSYFNLQEGLAEELEKNDEPNQENGKSSFNFFDKNIALASNIVNSENEIIIRGIATFLEIGKQKDIYNAEYINSSDIKAINEALVVLKRKTDNLAEFTGIIENKKELEYELVNSINEQYLRMELFLEELLKYKRFYQVEIEAVDMESMQKINNRINAVQEILASQGTKNDLYEFAADRSFEYKSAIEDQNDIFIKNIESLEGVKVPLDVLDRKILIDRLELRDEIFSASIKRNKSIIREFESSKDFLHWGKVLVRVHTSPSEFPELNTLKSLNMKIDENIFEYKNNSKISIIFKDIILADEEIKANAKRVEEFTKKRLFIGENSLSKSLEIYSRKERSDFYEKTLDLYERINMIARNESIKGEITVPIKNEEYFNEIEKEVYTGELLVYTHVDSKTYELEIFVDSIGEWLDVGGGKGNIDKFIISLIRPDKKEIVLDERSKHLISYDSNNKNHAVFVVKNPDLTGYWGIRVTPPVDNQKYLFHSRAFGGVLSRIKAYDKDIYEYIKGNADLVKMDQIVEEDFLSYDEAILFSGPITEAVSGYPDRQESLLPPSNILEAYIDLYRYDESSPGDHRQKLFYKRVYLKDDGIHPDKKEGNGFYAGVLSDVPKGSYDICFSVKGGYLGSNEYFEYLNIFRGTHYKK